MQCSQHQSVIFCVRFRYQNKTGKADDAGNRRQKTMFRSLQAVRYSHPFSHGAMAWEHNMQQAPLRGVLTSSQEGFRPHRATQGPSPSPPAVPEVPQVAPASTVLAKAASGSFFLPPFPSATIRRAVRMSSSAAASITSMILRGECCSRWRMGPTMYFEV